MATFVAQSEEGVRYPFIKKRVAQDRLSESGHEHLWEHATYGAEVVYLNHSATPKVSRRVQTTGVNVGSKQPTHIDNV